jgi:phage tail sheath protein FI
MQMPEYLAPGVYVEETSFRAKSIEGVSTSTTAFAGPSRKGPVCGGRTPVQPELLTSFGDFVRVFGGLNSLSFGKGNPNYLAHAVLNYFNEGGGRLYVLRTFNRSVEGDNAADTAELILAGEGTNKLVAFQARFPGEAGNATVIVREMLSPVIYKALEKAPVGTLLRAGSSGSEPARLQSAEAGPYKVSNGGELRLMVNKGKPGDRYVSIKFFGAPTEAKSKVALDDEITLTDTTNTLKVTLDDKDPQTITLPVEDSNGDITYTPASLALAINTRLSGGYAHLDKDNYLIIGTDLLGTDGKVKVEQSDKFGFTDPVTEKTGVNDPLTNNVKNLAAVDAQDVQGIIDDLSLDEDKKIAAEEVNGFLSIATVLKGTNANICVVDAGPDAESQHTALGYDLPSPGTPPMTGSDYRLYSKTDMVNNTWLDKNGVSFAVTGNPSNIAGKLITLAVTVQDADGDSEIFDDVSLNKNDVRYIGNVLAEVPTSRADALQHLIWCNIGSSCTPLELHSAIFPPDVKDDLENGVQKIHRLEGGSDGLEPIGGTPEQDGTYAAAFEQLRGLEDVSIVAAPGHASFSDYQNIQGLLISHADKPRAYRIAVLETPVNQTPGEARNERARIDSTHAALYYPWVTVSNPLARPGNTEPREIQLPPSGFICGIYARNDVEKSVSKAPANEVIRSALRFERDVNFAENQMLNPLGINCLRFFPGRGYRVWGARTVSSDPEWKYVNVRRYFNYLESSIDRGTQWAVFENNGERLWTNIRETIESFLYSEWVSGNLLGSNAKEAYFVRCDRSTMTQNDLDNGRLICLIGVAALKPAEFVIFRIGQKTADAKG